MSAHPLYAVIDLGSNSFHMLITRLVADSVQVVDKVKRKVRLASGLDSHNKLDQASISRGLECLSFFAERLQDIPEENIRIVATATLRIATNADEFIKQANIILGKNITVLTGEQEASSIYLGVAHTSCGKPNRLVFDIGGASTEIVAGEGFDCQKVLSLNIGCVTFRNRFFSDDLFNSNNFSKAQLAAKTEISPHVEDYKNLGWQIVLGGSGTMQALAEILLHQKQPAIISANFLAQIKKQIINCQSLDQLKIPGLLADRKPVFASGIAILITLFECFDVKELQLSSGAIREGLLYEMLPDMRALTIRQRTVTSLTEKFHIDTEHAYRVSETVDAIFDYCQSDWQITKDNGYKLLKTACALHEIGLLLEFKRHQLHGTYIIENADLPGFDQADRQLLAVLVLCYKADIDIERLKSQSAVSFEHACQLLVILRLAVIICRRRNDDVLPHHNCVVKDKAIELQLPKKWLHAHPLICDELRQESQHLHSIDYTIDIIGTE
ncbi:Ppx/GppA phosphatase family protein [Thalassotalea sp. PLHSN55]|uniref:Ppx/GppA phosphatase family protein n=1 Tax=Thalassotalea sp. PLHSN55 TaxID=3435888 RepID=UPI003F85153F